MKILGTCSLILAGLALTVLAISCHSASAAEALINGNLEESVSPLGWSLTTSITGAPGETIPSLFEHNDGGNQPTVMPGQLGLVVKPQAGNTGIHTGENLMTNLVLQQIVTGIPVAGRSYTFSGWSFWGGDADAGTNDGYSGGVDILHSGSPSDPTPMDPDDPGSVASPTENIFEVAFLNSSDMVLGSPVELDLRTQQFNDSTWRQHTLMTGPAPVGSTKVRVRAAATNIVENFGFQNMMLDNFNLKDSVTPGLERLVNPSLNSPGDPLGWTLAEGPDAQGGTADSSSFINFAQNPNSAGQQGLWLRPFVNTTQFEPDIPTVFATLTQVAPGVPGEDYTFSASTAWEYGYAGGISGSGVQTLLKMEFLDSSNAVIGSPVTLDLFAAGMVNDADEGNVEPEDWQQFSTPTAMAPEGTVSVRVSAQALDMFNSFINPQSAFFDDFSLITTAVAGLMGDFNDDGKVDAADYVTWRKNDGTNNPLPNDGGLGTPIDSHHYDLWAANFGNMAMGGGSLAAVPEPSSVVLLMGIALGMVGSGRRRSR